MADCTSSRCRTGVMMEGGRRVELTRYVLEQNRKGLDAGPDMLVICRACRVTSNGTGLVVRHGAVVFLVEQCVVSGNSVCGIEVESGGTLYVISCQIKDPVRLHQGGCVNYSSDTELTLAYV